MIQLLKEIQNLKHEDLNDMIRTICLVSNKKCIDETNKFDNGIIELMNFWGNGEGLCQSYVDNEREKIRREKERIRLEREKIERERQEKEKAEAEARAKEMEEKMGIKKKPKEETSLVPFDERETRQITTYDGRVVDAPFVETRPQGLIGKRAHLEIQRLKLEKEEKQEEEEIKILAIEAKKERAKVRAKRDFDRIKITHNVATGNIKDEQRELVFKDGELDKMKKMKPRHGLPDIELFDFDGEEERDVNAIKIFMKKYSKLWKYLFYKYANSGYSTRSINNFNDLQSKTDSINLAEIQKMLIEHNFSKKKDITQEEIQTLIKLINF